jgi:hypothetical protein
VRRRLIRLFTHDVGRKLLALFFALILFDVLDKKVQADDKLTVKVIYWNGADVERVPETPDRASKFIVAERIPGAKPLVVSTRPRPELVTFLLHGTKDAIEHAKSHRHTFVLRLNKEGVLDPTTAEIEGTSALLEELGPGARIDLEPVQWTVEPEEARTITLQHSDLVLRGEPAPGYDKWLNTAVFRPDVVRLVGPATDIAMALNKRELLLDPVMLDGQKEVTQDVVLHRNWADRLRMQDANGGEIDAVRVTVRFERRMVDVQGADGLFELPVQVVCNDDALRARDPQKSTRDGWRLRFPKAHDGELKLRLRIRAPEPFVSAPQLDRAKLKLARENVELVVRAQDASGVTAPVSIQRFPDFPAELDVVFEDGSSSADVEVQWVAPSTPTAAEKEKSGNDGDGNGEH